MPNGKVVTYSEAGEETTWRMYVAIYNFHIVHETRKINAMKMLLYYKAKYKNTITYNPTH